MNTTYRKIGAASAALFAGSLLLVPVLQANAGSLPDPDTVPCEAFGSDADCLSHTERRRVEPGCDAPALATDQSGNSKPADATDQPSSGTTTITPSSEDKDPGLVDLIAHTNRL